MCRRIVGAERCEPSILPLPLDKVRLAFGRDSLNEGGIGRRSRCGQKLFRSRRGLAGLVSLVQDEPHAAQPRLDHRVLIVQRSSAPKGLECRRILLQIVRIEPLLEGSGSLQASKATGRRFPSIDQIVQPLSRPDACMEPNKDRSSGPPGPKCS